MEVKTAELKNNLSKYLHRIQETGETLVICDRDEPVATVSPIFSNKTGHWQKYRAEAMARAKKMKIKIEIPEKLPESPAFPPGEPTLAPDGRTDLRSIDLTRGGKNY